MFYHAVLERVRGAVHGPDRDAAPAEQPETDASDHLKTPQDVIVA